MREAEWAAWGSCAWSIFFEVEGLLNFVLSYYTRVPSTFATTSSTSSSTMERRTPQQARATQRRAKFLAVAASLIGEQGYDAVTMTAIAEAAGASIGTLYDYFPDKLTLGRVLLARYVAEFDAHWKTLLEKAAGLTKAELADVFVEGTLTLAEELPGYLALFGSAAGGSRSAEDRQPVRRTISAAVQRMNAEIGDERAYLVALVIVELIKGQLAVYKQVAPEGRGAVTDEFKRMMRLYLMDTI